MSLTVLVTTKEPIEVRPVTGISTPIAIAFDNGVTIYLTDEQRTKLCFDLLATVPPIDVNLWIEHGLVSQPGAR